MSAEPAHVRGTSEQCGSTTELVVPRHPKQETWKSTSRHELLAQYSVACESTCRTFSASFSSLVDRASNLELLEYNVPSPPNRRHANCESGSNITRARTSDETSRITHL